MAQPYIYKYDDPSARVDLPHLVAQDLSFEGEGAFLQFAGRSLPVGVRAGRPLARRWNFEAVFSRTERHLADSLVELIDAAYRSSDARLVLVSEPSRDDEVSPRFVSEVHEFDMGREPGGIVRVSFEAREVEG